MEFEFNCELFDRHKAVNFFLLHTLFETCEKSDRSAVPPLPFTPTRNLKHRLLILLIACCVSANWRYLRLYSLLWYQTYKGTFRGESGVFRWNLMYRGNFLRWIRIWYSFLLNRTRLRVIAVLLRILLVEYFWLVKFQINLKFRLNKWPTLKRVFNVLSTMIKRHILNIAQIYLYLTWAYLSFQMLKW